MWFFFVGVLCSESNVKNQYDAWSIKYGQVKKKIRFCGVFYFQFLFYLSVKQIFLQWGDGGNGMGSKSA